MEREEKLGTGRVSGPDRLGWLLFLLIGGILVYQLLVPPIVGMADNGDFSQIIEPLGLRPVADTWEEKFFLHVNRQYQAVPPTKPVVLSTDLLLSAIALRLDHLVTRDDVFDLLTLGTLHLLLYLFGIYLIVAAARTFSRPVRLTLGLGLLLSATDVAYVATLNSFYTESASLIFLAIWVGLALRDARAGTFSLPRIAACFLAAALLAASKPQNCLLALPLAAFPVLLHWGGRRRASTLIPAAALCLLVGSLVARIPPTFRVHVLWDTVFYSILPHSPSPESDLHEFGLDPDLARFAGATSWDAGVPLYETTARYGYGAIARFYLRHPGRFLGLCAVCARHAFTWREPLIGNFTRNSGRPPRALSRAFAGWSGLENRVLPKSIWFLAAVLSLVLAFSARVCRRNGLSSREGGTALVVATIAVMAILAFLVCVAAEGPKDLVKHLYLFQVLFDACLLALLAHGAGWATRALSQRRRA